MTKNRRGKWIVLLAGAATVAVLYATGIGCPVRAVFGVRCPGCGLTRAVLACLRLDAKAAFAWHPMVFSLPLLFAYFWRDGKVFRSPAVNLGVLAALAAGFLGVWLARL